MNLQNVKEVFTRISGRGGILLKKNSPEILMVTGVVGIVASTVMACRATLKAGDVIDEAKEKLDKINQAKELIGKPTYDIKDRYTEQDYKKDLAITYVQTGVEFAKLYAPAVLISVASIGCILGSHGIMKRRNLALVAAYKAIETSFSDYRKRVAEEFGDEKDRLLKNGIVQSKISVMEIDEDGKSKKTQKVVETVDPNNISQYARFFDEASINWSKTPEYNLTFLKCQQNYANDLLKSRGHIFLNEVYDLLGIPRSQAGAIVGWVREVGDGFVDFGLFDGENMSVRDFVNGYERSILLDFNVDGVIYDMIWMRDGLNAKGSGYMWRDILDYPGLYYYL